MFRELLRPFAKEFFSFVLCKGLAGCSAFFLLLAKFARASGALCAKQRIAHATVNLRQRRALGTGGILFFLGNKRTVMP